MHNAFLRAMEFRHACKLFRTDLHVTQEEVNFVLEAGRLSPSSMGLEPWYFLVVADAQLKAKLQKTSWDQAQIGTSSVVIAILAKKAELKPGSVYARAMLKRLAVHPHEEDMLEKMYAQMAATTDLVAWSVAQCHLAAANMMTAAAYIGIDSCPVGGFDIDAASITLALDRERFDLALLLPLGHRLHEPPARHRLPLAALVEYR